MHEVWVKLTMPVNIMQLAPCRAAQFHALYAVILCI